MFDILVESRQAENHSEADLMTSSGTLFAWFKVIRASGVETLFSRILKSCQGQYFVP